MNWNDTIGKLSPELKSNGIQGHKHLDNIHSIDKEVEGIESQLLDCHIECEQTEKSIYEVDQLKDKGTFVLKNVERRYGDLDEDLKEIHCNYVKCMKKATSGDTTVHLEVNSLTIQRDSLKKELAELTKISDENKKKLVEVKKMIVIQEKKNLALAKKLKKLRSNVRMTPHLKNRLNTILNDPRITNVKHTMKPSD